VINNAAKYSGAKKVVIALSKTNQHVKMIVTDDGKGFDTSIVFTGNGMGSLKKRATELNGDCSIRSFIGGGTVVTLLFKIT
jgi:signal transduction histidine kinase